ncbi:hypothetical protein [Chimaeribacter coloradensis]|uniref:hypothetical protein n=1 Tax=Chimaeribacter coloradensis TaxID=2060068 RepID=UPI0011AFC9E2|nr:hypothetical protein [Chimaeribacter coloradensis]
MNAVKFLEAAPERSLVLESFAKLTSPTSWSGNLANIWQSRADAFSELIEHLDEENLKMMRAKAVMPRPSVNVVVKTGTYVIP